MGLWLEFRRVLFRSRLGVKSPVSGILVFPLARGAHDESLHRRVRPVIGNAQNDAVPWSAVRAVRERIPEPPIRRIEQFSDALRAGRDVRQDRRRRLAAPAAPARGGGTTALVGPAAGPDPERGVARRIQPRGLT